MSQALALTRRDARRDPRRDVDEPDYTKLLLVAAAVGAGVLVWWKFGRDAQASPPGGPGGTQPGPGPGNIPAPPNASLPPTPRPGNLPATLSGDDAAQGDVITVSPSALAAVLGGASVPTGDVELVVTGASPRTPIVLGQTTGTPAGVPAGIQVPVPRTAITSVTRGGATPPAPQPLPAIPSGGAALVPVDLGSPMPLRQGRHYRARLQLSSLEQMLANPSAVAGQLTAAGFSDVRVYKINTDPLPSDWPLVTIAAPADGGSWFAEGSWPNADASVPRPPQIILAWEQ